MDIDCGLNNSGFGWNSDLNLPTAPSEVWNYYILFGNRVATGKFARSSAMIASQYAESASSSLSDFHCTSATPRSSFTAGPSTTKKTYRSNSPYFSISTFCFFLILTFDRETGVDLTESSSEKTKSSEK